MKLMQAIRQLKYPSEFRIPEYQFSNELAQGLDQILHDLTLFTEQEAQESRMAEKVSDLSEAGDTRFLADVATGLWRLKSKMANSDSGEPLEGMSRAFRHFESVWQAFSQAGIDIRDHTNEPFDPGMSLTAIAFQPTPGLNRDMIIETIKPTVYNKDERIQKGEIIVGTKP